MFTDRAPRQSSIPDVPDSSNDDGDCMPAGEHYLPFSFSLPPNLPPSFEGDYGYIRYWAKASHRPALEV